MYVCMYVTIYIYTYIHIPGPARRHPGVDAPLLPPLLPALQPAEGPAPPQGYDIILYCLVLYHSIVHYCYVALLYYIT